MPSDGIATAGCIIDQDQVGLHLEGESQRGPFADVEVCAYRRDCAGVWVTDA
jgi:hypothetical protein